MKLTTSHLTNWVNTNQKEAQITTPLLIRKLIYAISNDIKEMVFPAGDSTALPGWDGILEATTANRFVPEGTSRWEIGTDKDIKGKADLDYDKRCQEAHDFANITFVFVTPRVWTNKDTWLKEKVATKKWKAIHVIDATNLEEWLECCPAVANWFAKKINVLPETGVQSATDFWENWSKNNSKQISLPPSILLGGREQEREKLYAFVEQPKSLSAVKSISAEESLAFIIACFKEINNISFFSKCLIVDTSEAFKKLSTTKIPLILIPKFKDNGEINAALNKGHTIILPLDLDAPNQLPPNNPNKIVLPFLQRDIFVKSLIQAGLSETRAEKESKETARNITILRHRLEFTFGTPEWASYESVQELMPILLAGRWTEKSEGDKELISELSGMPYEDYVVILEKNLRKANSPIMKIGDIWRLISPFDTWIYALQFINSKNFAALITSFLKVLGEVNPAFELAPNLRCAAAILGKQKKYSHELSEGLCASLTLISILEKTENSNRKNKINEAVYQLLDTTDINVWYSLNNLLPMLAEIAPTSFLDVITQQFSNSTTDLFAELFKEETDNVFNIPINHAGGLLDALRRLAWFPEYLIPVTSQLAQFSKYPAYQNNSNTPTNLLQNIFCIWSRQTFASLDIRLEALSLFMNSEPQICWQVITKLLNARQVITSGHTFRWRMIENEIPPILYSEYFETQQSFLNLLLSNFDYTEAKLFLLISLYAEVSHLQEPILSFVENVSSQLKNRDYTAWHELRRIIWLHNLAKSKANNKEDNKFILSPKNLKRFKNLYKNLAPDATELAAITWLFEVNPNFIDISEYAPYSEEERNFILNKRILALKKYYKSKRLDSIIQLIGLVKQPSISILGETLAHILKTEAEILECCQFLKADKGTTKHCFIGNFIIHKICLFKNQEEQLAFVQKWVIKLTTANFDDQSICNFLLYCPINKDILIFLEQQNQNILDLYWANMQGYCSLKIDLETRIFVFKKLIAYERIITAIERFSYDKEIIVQLSSEFILSFLFSINNDKSINKNLNYSICYNIFELFKELNTRSDISLENRLNLELFYHPILISLHNTYKSFWLYKEMSQNASFFIEIIQKYCTAKEEKWALFYYKVLNKWKYVPARNKEELIDISILQNWIKEIKFLAKQINVENQVEFLAKQINVENQVNYHIGRVLTQCAQLNGDISPTDEICELIENHLLLTNATGGIYSTFYNGQGGVYNATVEYYANKNNIFNNLHHKHQYKYPKLAKIFKNLATDFQRSAEKEIISLQKRDLEY